MNMNNNGNQDGLAKTSPPTFSGRGMPMNVNTAGLDEDAPQVSRRVAFQPSFEPISSFEPVLSKSCPLSVGASKASPVKTPQQVMWNLSKVPTLPQFHNLERTAVFCPNESPSEISQRISDVLRERSIEASFDEKKARAKCLTSQGVDFRIRLYRGRGRFDHGIIVEVQRRFGAAHTFYDDTMAILDVAEGKIPSPPSHENNNLPLVSDEDDSESSFDGSSSLEMVSKMLSHAGQDSHHLALQTLSSFTDSSKIGAGTAQAVVKELLRGDNTVGDKILALVNNKNTPDDQFNLRSMALTVLANSFTTMNGDVPLSLKESLRESLIEELRRASSSPVLAYQAARCLEFFVPEDTGSDLFTALNLALEVGKVRHAALHRQAGVCLNKLP